MRTICSSLLFLIFIGVSPQSFAQSPALKPGQTTITIAAGPEYKKSASFQRRWGKNYRTSWYTPVTLPIAMLDTLNGGMKPIKAGGGHQTKSLHLESQTGKKYTLRSVNKTLGKVLPEDFLGTFIEKLVNDKVSMSHPYGAPVVAYMAERANVYHTNPQFYYVPDQPATDTFPKFGNAVYLYEQKLDGNWKEADNLGNFEHYYGTFKVIDSLLSSNIYRVDQHQYVRSRLFDMLINDWDRHEDQWEWGIRQKDGLKIFVPVPQDRDQAFYTYDGFLLSFALSASGMKYFQPFNGKMKDVNTFNYEQRNLDRLFANRLTLTDWQNLATALQQSVTDAVIDAAVEKIPKEARDFSAVKIAETLKARRERMVDYATTYYKFIAKEVDIPASKKNERIAITNSDDKTTVAIYYTDSSTQNEKLYYSRDFLPAETKEIRVYGVGGNDHFNATGGDASIKIRMVGGPETDTMFADGKNVKIYDNKTNVLEANNGARMHLSDNDSLHQYKFKQYSYDKSGITPVFFFNNDDFFYVGLAYGKVKHSWRKDPYASKQNISVNYSLSQSALSVTYNAIIKKVFGNWDLGLRGNWDAVRWTNFFGLGNDTKFEIKDINFYRARSEQWLGSVGLIRNLGPMNFRVNAFYQSVRIINDNDRYSGKILIPVTPDVVNTKHFTGVEFLYRFNQVNDPVVPTKGLVFWGRAAYTMNLKQTGRTVGDYQAHLRLFVPLVDNLSLSLSGGGETVTGKPEFYQYATIGGPQTLRGFRLNRFWGKTAFYNDNEIRYIRNVKSYYYNGKIGLLAFLDNGRVWMQNETASTTWHTGYGAALILVPFNKIMAQVSYGISNDDRIVQFKVFIPIK